MKGKMHWIMFPIIVFATLLVLTRIGTALADTGVTGQAAQAAPGFYIISCFMEPPLPGTGQEPCPTGNQIPIGSALVLNAHVTDSSGTLAKSGMWIFQDCLLNGVPAPSIHCDSGPGTWSNIQRVHFKGQEDIRVGYGRPSTPQTIGFRFRYLAGQGSGIANGISNSMDVTWF